jgi:hypothetical protein
LRERAGRNCLSTAEGRGIGIINKIRAYALQDQGADTIEANEQLGLAVDLRCYEQCAEILRDLGLSRVRLISNNPEKMQALARMGLDVVERVSMLIPPTDAAKVTCAPRRKDWDISWSWFERSRNKRSSQSWRYTPNPTGPGACLNLNSEGSEEL